MRANPRPTRQDPQVRRSLNDVVKVEVHRQLHLGTARHQLHPARVNVNLHRWPQSSRRGLYLESSPAGGVQSDCRTIGWINSADKSPDTAAHGSINGLTTDEAEIRLKKFGPNAMPDTTVHPLRSALSKFWTPVPWMLEAAIVT